MRVAKSGSSPRVRGTPRLGRRALRRGRFIPACAGNSSACRAATPSGTVHPRVCGELLGTSPNGAQIAGSSPRVRGTRNCRAVCVAGVPVHPRVCGELTTNLVAQTGDSGSSPRVRGTPADHRGYLAHRRFIPACAGNSIHGSSLSSGCRGSSPRVRGTLRPAAAAAGPLRFIPACAGNSARTSTPAAGSAVHPRVCGELAVGGCRSRIGGGSSPRVRGTLGLQLAHLALARFIPACAGNSLPVVPSAWPLAGSSPRVRGTPYRRATRPSSTRFIPACAGNSGAGSVLLLPGNGSSPRVRGTRASPRPSRRSARFIPACAGNSSNSCLCAHQSAVHPRVCGELRVILDAGRGLFGSSPRVRGTRHPLPARRLVRRFIPACAGNS